MRKATLHGQIVCVKKSICELKSILRPFMKSFLMYPIANNEICALNESICYFEWLAIRSRRKMRVFMAEIVTLFINIHRNTHRYVLLYTEISTAARTVYVFKRRRLQYDDFIHIREFNHVRTK